MLEIKSVRTPTFLGINLLIRVYTGFPVLSTSTTIQGKADDFGRVPGDFGQNKRFRPAQSEKTENMTISGFVLRTSYNVLVFEHFCQKFNLQVIFIVE